MPSPQVLAMREAIQKADDLHFELVEVNEWAPGLVIKVTTMNGTDRSRFQASMVDLDSGEPVPDHMLAQIVIACARHPETDERLFDADDLAWLSEKNGAILEKVAMAGMRVSGIQKDSVDEIAVNSSITPSDDTSSDSPTD